MSTKPKYYIVESSALPEVFLKVAEAKRLLSTGEASTVNEATRMTDISRSAFYKYRDAVLPFQSMMTPLFPRSRNCGRMKMVIQQSQNDRSENYEY